MPPPKKKKTGLAGIATAGVDAQREDISGPSHRGGEYESKWGPAGPESIQQEVRDDLYKTTSAGRGGDYETSGDVSSTQTGLSGLGQMAKKQVFGINPGKFNRAFRKQYGRYPRP